MAINVVGAGLAGSILTTLLRAHGFEVRLFDDGDPHSGSRASSNLYLASWLNKFGEDANTGLSVLEELYSEVAENPFERGLAAAAKVRHVPQRHILVPADIAEPVLEVQPGLVLTERNVYPGEATVLCCGYRATELAPWLQVKSKVGHAFLFRARLKPGHSRIALISPYRHEKLYQYDPEHVYYADSVAVAPEQFWARQEELRQRTEERARRWVGDSEVAAYMVGYRPFLGGPSGVAYEARERLWVLNGGGKNGMAAYAAGAYRIANQLMLRRSGRGLSVPA